MEFMHDKSHLMLIAAFVVLLTLIIVGWRNKCRNLPPGPWGLPFVGYLPFISTTHLDLFALSKVYGNVFSFRTVGGKLIIVLNGVKTIKEVFVNRSDEFDGRPLEKNLISWFSNGLGIAQEEGEPWMQHRRFFLHTAKNIGFGKLALEEQIQDEIQPMLRQLRHSSEPGNLHFNLAYAANSVISLVLFGRKLEKNRTFADILAVTTKVVESFTKNIHLILGYSFDLLLSLYPPMRETEAGLQELRRITDGIVQEQILTFDSTHLRGYVDSYILHMNERSERRKPEAAVFNEERLKAITMNLILEGTESVTSTIMNMLLELSKHCDVQLEAQREVDSVIGKERLPSWGDRSKLPYLDATIQELYRTASLFIVSAMHSNFKEATIEGFRIPERSVIVANFWSINYDPEIFPNPQQFDPNRFLNSDGKRVKKEGPYPFSIGKRSCVGESLAQTEVFLLIASLLQHFNIPPAENVQELKVVPRT